MDVEYPTTFTDEFNLTFSQLLITHVHLFDVSASNHQTAEITTSVRSMNRPLSAPVQCQFVFKRSSSSCCSHFHITSHKSTTNSWATVPGHSETLNGMFWERICHWDERVTESSAGHNRDWRSHSKWHSKTTSHADGCFTVNSALWTFSIVILLYPPLLLAFVSMNCLRRRNYHSMLILKCSAFMI